MAKVLLIFTLIMFSATFVHCGIVAELRLSTAESLKACVATVQASEQDVSDLVLLQPAGTHEGKCLRACILTDLGLMKDGVIDYKATLDIAVKLAKKLNLDTSDTLDFFHECSIIDVGELCENAELYMACLDYQAQLKRAPLK